ncbi:MAG: hypothetical protein L3K23_03620 [Thermoplasmata archaeon]|nr:hypothetical protein [Thermoplasmata archaeon]
MPSPDDGAGPEEPRVPTGIPELDAMLEGGLVAHRPYLIVGPAGSGKTKLALRFLVEGIRRGENCLVVTLEEPPNEMKINHRGMQEDLDRVYVFDAIPDVMRYERAPFKDIAAVRASVRFSDVPLDIRKTPELSSIEVTFTALEQTLKMEMARRPYARLVIDSLTALQYFCMKGFDETIGAQTFLRFLADLRITTLLTVEAPLEDVETAERQLARGEIRLFRWDLEGRTVRAIGVEKIRGSPHDVRLHPYRITPAGIEINLGATISRDTRQIVEGLAVEAPPSPRPAAPTPAEAAAPPAAFDVGAFDEELAALLAVHADVHAVRSALDAAASARARSRPDAAAKQLERAAVVTRELLGKLAAKTPEFPPSVPVSARDRLLELARNRADRPVGPLRSSELDAAWKHIEPFLSQPVPARASPPVAAPAPPAAQVPAPGPPAVRTPAAPPPPSTVVAAPTPPPPVAAPPVPLKEEPPGTVVDTSTAKPGGPITRTATKIAGAFVRAGGAIAHPGHPGETAPSSSASSPTPPTNTPPPPPAGPPPLPASRPSSGTPHPAAAAPTAPPEPSRIDPASARSMPSVTIQQAGVSAAPRPPLPDAAPTETLLARPPSVDPSPSPVVPVPSEPVPAAPPVPTPSKTRRRATATPRKRKAPPVDSVSVPTPPAATYAPSAEPGPSAPMSEKPPSEAAPVIPKVNRRKPRKKKASPVESAIPGASPPSPAAPASAPAATEPSPSPPPKEEPKPSSATASAASAEPGPPGGA